MPSKNKSEPRPRLACEISAGRVIAARRADKSATLEAYTARTLAEGAVVPNLGGQNVFDGVLLRQAISDALATVGSRSRDITALLPDAAVRVVLLDFDTLPEKRPDAEAVIRFRLKKSLPFEVDKAALSFQASRSNGTVSVVATVALTSVVEEYESAFRDAGYEPGVVLPATLAALGPVSATAPTLVIKLDAVTTSVAIAQNDDLLLFRTLENPRGTDLDSGRIAEEVYPSMVFFEDTFGTRVERILVGGVAGAEEVGAALESQTGIRPQDLVSSSQVGTGGNIPRWLLAGVVGALTA